MNDDDFLKKVGLNPFLTEAILEEVISLIAKSENLDAEIIKQRILDRAMVLKKNYFEKRG